MSIKRRQAQTMKCFVIMPYNEDFGDVHQAILDAATESKGEILCSRHDMDRQGGRKIKRLEDAIKETDICVADLSGGNCNVMWEVGYAMALGKQVILISQGEEALPFDVLDVHHIVYNRRRLRDTLTAHLKVSFADTVRSIKERPKDVDLREIVASLVRESMHATISPVVAPSVIPSLSSPQIVGAWMDSVTQSHIYVRLINDQLVAPYCYGANNELSGFYYDFRRTGEYIFGRYLWLHQPISGFSFLKQESASLLSGAWWFDHEANADPETMPSLETGWTTRWMRLEAMKEPDWAKKFFDDVSSRGLAQTIKSPL